MLKSYVQKKYTYATELVWDEEVGAWNFPRSIDRIKHHDHDLWGLLISLSSTKVNISEYFRSTKLVKLGRYTFRPCSAISVTWK